MPLKGDFNRVAPEGRFAVWASEDSGKRWSPMVKGLPTVAYFTVLREGLSTDTEDPCGVCVGTTTGQLFFSGNQGEEWTKVTDSLPCILSVSMSNE